MSVDPIEGEAIDSDYVERFARFVYAAMVTADSAGYVVGSFSSLVECLGPLGASDAEVARCRATVQKARKRVDRMETEALRGASLTPLLLEAAAFDTGLNRMNAQWKAAAVGVARIHREWDRLVSSMIPGARRAAGLATYALLASERGWPSGCGGAVPIEDHSSRENASSVDSHRSVLGEAMRLLAAPRSSLERREVFTAKSMFPTIAVIAGAVAHAVARGGAVVTVRPVARPQRFVRFILPPDHDGFIESVGSYGLDTSERITRSERNTLMTMRFDPPTRRVRERHWRLGTPGTSVTGIAEAMTVALLIVHGVAWGDRLEITTGAIDHG